MTDGSIQSAIDLRCKNARDQEKALHLNETRIPCTGCCFSHNRLLAVIMPECDGGVAPPEFIKFLHDGQNDAWTWLCAQDSSCLSGGTCHPNRKMCRQIPDMPFHVARRDSAEVLHFVAPESPRSRPNSAMAEPPTMAERQPFGARVAR